MSENTYKFTPEQEEWLQALESGKYKKGIAKLKGKTNQGDITYCCLGVACEIFKDRLNLVETHDEEDFKYRFDAPGWKDINSGYYPPMLVVDLLKLGDHYGGLTFTGINSTQVGCSTLTEVNDHKYKEDTHFKNVAAFIRENAANIFIQK